MKLFYILISKIEIKNMPNLAFNIFYLNKKNIKKADI